MKINSNPNHEAENDAREYPDYGKEYAADLSAEKGKSTSGAGEKSGSRFPMEWHKFLMVTMIIGAVVTVINGLLYITGFVYERNGVTSAQVYSTFPGIKSCDTVYGIFLILVGVFQIIVRNHLHGFKKDALCLLVCLFSISLTINIFYQVIASFVADINPLDASVLGTVIGTLLYMIPTIVYYQKRSVLFVN